LTITKQRIRILLKVDCGLTGFASSKDSRLGIRRIDTDIHKIFEAGTQAVKSPVLLAIVAALLALSSPTRAADLAIVGATVHPSPTAAAIAKATVIVRNGRIERVGMATEVRVPAGTTVMDATGMTMVAGFWNSHVHLTAPDLLNAKSRPAAVLDAALQRMLTRWGFTAVFDMASAPGNSVALRTRIESGEVAGPMVLTVDAPFYPQNGTPIYVRNAYRENGWPSAEVATASEAAARARQQIAGGADGVKLFTGAIIGQNDVLPLDAAIAKSVVDVAHAQRKLAFAHPTDLRGLDIAIDAGVDVLAHPTFGAGPWPAALVERIRARGIALVPTLELVEIELRGAPQQVRERFARNAAQQVKALADAGGTILFGTDVGYIDAVDTARELRLMADAGLDWRAILASLTTSPAARYGFEARKGRIAAGMDADLVLLGSDPARDPAAFADVRITLRGGNVLYRAR
jgi:imidazolonepropionase-like amidohydrolase